VPADPLAGNQMLLRPAAAVVARISKGPEFPAGKDSE
jgi:hypothetical protein